MNEQSINRINKFIEGKTFDAYFVATSYSNKVRCSYQFKIDKIHKLISIGEWTEFLFVSVKIVDGTGIMALYLDNTKGQKFEGRQSVNNYWYRVGAGIAYDIESFLKFFNVDLPVVVDNLEFSEDFDINQYFSSLK